ncbi:hypothetical protein CTEN210_10155 [Chaetoceros tenuissimus]|uniref:F-box domain-containing protein n=1 Tax=Chaetoceros tenuissimus TaxID=426638 RepID=A0AAD3CXF3_9STRA|nr:hypothetical protein CTEN210_10155 [Chaetoceros tenuissimus]
MDTSEESTFPLLDLQTELVVDILDFVFDVPCENNSREYKSSSTHVLPFVCKEFYRFCKRDFFWRASMMRLMKKDKKQIAWPRVVEDFATDNGNSNVNITGPEALLKAACERMSPIVQQQQERYGGDESIYKNLFRYLLNEGFRFFFPIFYMPDPQLIRGRRIGLHFFEPRYRRLIREVMNRFPANYRQGENLDNVPRRPRFIYAHRSPLAKNQVALVVEVAKCIIYEDGTADVELDPVEHVHIIGLYEQGNDHLYIAQAVNMPLEEEDEIEDNVMMDIAMAQRRAIGNYSIPIEAYLHEIQRLLGRSAR